MKKLLLVSALRLRRLGGMGSWSGAEHQRPGQPVKSQSLPSHRTAPPLTPSARGGVIPTAMRNGNPLQMLNPRAPARYGNSQEHVSQDPNDPGKVNGVKLFEWTF